MAEERDLLADLAIAVEAADSKGATAPIALRVTEHFGLADVFLIVSGSVERNVQAISDEIEEQMLQAGLRAIRREGRASGRWVLLDFGDILVHVFHEEDREYYQLERLWHDCPTIDISEMLSASV